jgi:hypothetical protein
MQPNNIDPWIHFLKTLLDRPIPIELEQSFENENSIESRDKNINWKLKGVAAKLTQRIFIKYGRVSKINQ